MIKNNKTLTFATCLLLANAYNPLQARSIPILAVGSVVAAGGIFYTNTQLAVVTDPVYQLLSTKEDTKKASRHLLAGIATTAVGLFLLGYGASR